ncbi:hypothetical protein [Phytohalomonas tamaricis]|nr:hypothetical protein [Phytohalomonas tamaricis]
MTAKSATLLRCGNARYSARGNADQAPRWIHAPRAVRRPYLTDPPA